MLPTDHINTKTVSFTPMSTTRNAFFTFIH